MEALASVASRTKKDAEEEDVNVFKHYNIKTWVQFLKTPTTLSLLEFKLSEKFQISESSSLSRRGAFRALISWTQAIAERDDWMESSLEQLGEQLLLNLRNVISIERGIDPVQLSQKVEELVDPGDKYAAKTRALEPRRSAAFEQGRIPQRSAQKRCLVCGRLGHFARTCWVKHPELKPQAEKGDSAASKRKNGASGVASS